MAIIKQDYGELSGEIDPVLIPIGTWVPSGQSSTVNLSEPIKKAHIIITGNGSTISGINATYIQEITNGLTNENGNFARLNVYEYDGPSVSSFVLTGYQGYSNGVVLKYE